MMLLLPAPKSAFPPYILAALAAALLLAGCGAAQPSSDGAVAKAAPSGPPTLELTPRQVGTLKLETVGTHAFTEEKHGVGSITFEDERSVQVFPSYQGKIMASFVALGEDVQRGQALYSIDSPDLIQAEASLIAAAATYDLTRLELGRAKQLTGPNGVSQRELEQATSDEATADGAFRAARDAVRIFGKSEAEIGQIVATRKIDPALVVVSPIAGRIIQQETAPGTLVQPGTAPAPYTVANVSQKWLLATVPESDYGAIEVGQPLQATVAAYPDRIFAGTISKVYATVDPTTHRFTVRSVITDNAKALVPGMLVNFTIRVRGPQAEAALPVNGAVRETDGTMTAWVTTDQKHFQQRLVTLGPPSDGYYPIQKGLRLGETVVTDGAVFLSNLLNAPPTD